MIAPLADLTILDLTRVLAGPFATMTLADLGANVIKVERPGRGDDTRAFPPFRDGQSAYFAAINRAKQSIALDLKSPPDRAIFDRLLARADVMVENFQPGVMDRLGYGWPTVHARHTRLIYASVSGFGQTGPDAGAPAYDIVVQARGGVMATTGVQGHEPVRVGASIGDIVAGMFLTEGILAALYARTRDGQGRRIDVGMLDSQLAIQEHAIAITTTTGHAPGPLGARHPIITPFDLFHAADGPFVIAAGNDAVFADLCRELGLKDLPGDVRFTTNGARTENADMLKSLIEAVTLTAPAAHWTGLLQAAGLPTAAVQDMAAVLEDPQIKARNMVARIGDSGFVGAGNPIKMTGLPDPVNRPGAPGLDADRAAVLQWLDAAEGGVASADAAIRP